MKIFLWSLKLGGLLNLIFLGISFLPVYATSNPHILIPARIFFTVSAYRCMFPVRYRGYIVFHNTILSSIFLTRFLATFSEIALIYQLAYLIRFFNTNNIHWLVFLSWLMVALVVLSQFYVWVAILTNKYKFFFFEELGWGFIYAINTILSLYLYATSYYPQSCPVIIQMNILFGIVYLPWQILRLRSIYTNTQSHIQMGNINNKEYKNRLKDSFILKKSTIDYQAWGGIVGMIWMTAYWATLIPIWVFVILQNIGSN